MPLPSLLDLSSVVPPPTNAGVISGEYQAFMTDRIVLEFLANNYGASAASLHVSAVIEQNPFSFAFNYLPNNTMRAFVDLGILQVAATDKYQQVYKCALVCWRLLMLLLRGQFGRASGALAWEGR